MKLTRLMLLFFIGVGLITPISAQNAQLRMSMDEAQDARDDLEDALNAKDPAKTGQALDKLTKVILEAKTFWAGQKQADIVKLADNALAASSEIGKMAAAKGDPKPAFKKLELACQQCHDLHPENRLK